MIWQMRRYILLTTSSKAWLSSAEMKRNPGIKLKTEIFRVYCHSRDVVYSQSRSVVTYSYNSILFALTTQMKNTERSCQSGPLSLETHVNETWPRTFVLLHLQNFWRERERKKGEIWNMQYLLHWFASDGPHRLLGLWIWIWIYFSSFKRKVLSCVCTVQGLCWAQCQLHSASSYIFFRLETVLSLYPRRPGYDTPPPHQHRLTFLAAAAPTV